jgi:sulfide:quinone oxidoreductase
MSEFRVVICGGGVAAIEGLLRLRRLAGTLVQLKLVAPNREFYYRPMAVAEPFGFGTVHRYPLKQIAADAEAEWLHDRLSGLDIAGRRAFTKAGGKLGYDALLLAVGARLSPASEHVTTLTDADAQAAFDGVVRQIDEGTCKSVAFILPEGPVWPLPLYEFALMTAERARRRGIEDLALTFVTSEPEPLDAFGPPASAVMRQRLQVAGIQLFTKAAAYVPDPNRILVQPQGVEFVTDRIVSLPLITGPGIEGPLGTGAPGFIPIDRRCAVPGTDGRVFAAGDVTAFPIKHGGLGAQQADIAAAGIARLAGAEVKDVTHEPVLRGKLLTGKAPLYLSGRLTSSHTIDADVSERPPWPSDDKIVAEELGPYLETLTPR